MIQRLRCFLFGHSPVIRITQIATQPNVMPENFCDPTMFNHARFGSVTIQGMCPCGRSFISVMLGKQIAPENWTPEVKQEIEELRRMARLD